MVMDAVVGRCVEQSPVTVTEDFKLVGHLAPGPV
jgi:hypothetical protein